MSLNITKVSFHSVFSRTFQDNNKVMIIKRLDEFPDQVGDSYCAIAGEDVSSSLTTCPDMQKNVVQQFTA